MKVLFYNSSHLLLEGACMNFNVIKKINTRILSLITIHYHILKLILNNIFDDYEKIKERYDLIEINKMKFINKI